MRKFQLNLGNVEYDVQISDDIFKNLDSYLLQTNHCGNLVFVIDEFIEKKYFPKGSLMHKKLGLFYYVVSGKKNNKSFYSAMKIFEYLDNSNIARDGTIIAIGGGVIGDLGGFIASCWYRGVNLIHIPTTLLAAVDSCVGGKTALNFRNTVNAVGTYHHPKAIFVDTKILSELPLREIASGFGEIIKYGVLGCNQIIDLLQDINFEFPDKIGELVELSLTEKEKYVRGDIKELSSRLYLNFGHTIGHAIEFSTIFNGEETLRHGEGVGLGMLAIFRIGIHLGYLSESDIDLLRALLNKFKLPTSYCASQLGLSQQALVERVLNLCFKDKKRTQTELRLVLLDGIGNPFMYKTSDRQLISKGIMEVII
jgi:3-dehydroquinate synthase